MAKALRAFRDGTGDEWDWSGAILQADYMDDLGLVRRLFEGFLGLKKHERKDG
jgi:hypothetical protein